MDSPLPFTAGFAGCAATARDLNFDEEYYRNRLSPEPYDRSNVHLVASFAVIADQLIRSLQPKTVLDAGCAMGFLVEAFWDRGVTAWGVDISDYAIARVRRDTQPYCRVGSIAEPIEGRYDLVTCIEVLEHMHLADALHAIDNLTSITDTILFSSTATDFEEATHVNVRQPIWWVDQFQQRGFVPDLIFDAGFVAPQAMLLRRSSMRLDWSMQRLFCELLRYKYAVTERDRTSAKLNDTVAQLQARSAEAKSLLEQEKAARIALQHEIQAIKADSEAAGERSDATVAGLTQRLEDSKREFVTLLQESQSMRARLEIATEEHRRISEELASVKSLREADRKSELERSISVAEKMATQLAESRAPVSLRPSAQGRDAILAGRTADASPDALEQIVEKHVLLLATFEDLALERDRVLRQLEATTGSGLPATDPPDSGAFNRKLDNLSLQVSSLARNVQALQASVGTLKTQVSDILSSRIWRTLVSAGGIMLRFSRRKEH